MSPCLSQDRMLLYLPEGCCGRLPRICIPTLSQMPCCGSAQILNSRNWRELAYVHICHIMTSPPLILAGTHSAEYIGMVALLGPIPRPKQNLARNRCHHCDVNACATQVALEMRQVTKMVPRRPKTRFKGSVSQQPSMAQHR